jgi:hypothetical protein
MILARKGFPAGVRMSDSPSAISSEFSDDENLFTKREVARLCGVDVRTVDRWLMAGKVVCHRRPSGRVLFRKHHVLNVVARGQT